MRKKDKLFLEACQKGDIIKAEKLLKKSLFSKPADISYSLPFEKAVQSKNPQIVDFLLQKGACMNDFCLKHAIDFGNSNDKATLDIVTSLISAGANPNKTWEKESLLNEILNKEPKSDPNTVYQSIALQLIKGGADINAVSSKWNKTPLHQASYNGYTEIVRILLEKGADVNVMDSAGNNSLILASYSGNEQIVEMLTRNGANVNQKDADERTPLIIAAKQGYKSIVSMLIAKGADINAKDKYLSTALTYSPSYEIADLLIKNGAHINERNHRGETPLIFATINKHKDVVAFLISNGANVSCVDDEQKQAIDYANEDIRPLFLD